MLIKIILITCVIILGIGSMNYLDNKLDTIIENQIIATFNAGENIVCGDYILNRNNSHLDNGYFISEDLIKKMLQ